MSEKQPEQGTDSVRVGVYVCHCGGNISDVVDTSAVVKAAEGNPNVHVAREFAFMCSDPGQKLIIDDILANGVNRVVVSACSPTLHELTFRTALQRAGLNPYLYEHVNVREQCSWVHKSNHEAATQKAIRLTMAGVEKVARQDPLEAIRVHAEKHVVVIGAGIAGMRGALALAAHGMGVTLLEQAETTGGRVADMGVVYPTGTRGSELAGSLGRQVAADEHISLRTGVQIVTIEGYVGNFTVRFRVGEGEPEEVRAGALLLAMGYDHYQPRPGELGYGESPMVKTLPDFQRLVAAAGSTASELLVDGRPVRSVAFVHCVGSRQTEGVESPGPDGHLNDYCSRVCCTAALYTINQTLDRFPNLQIYDLYRDIRTYGRGQEDYYEAASRRGVLFFRFTPDAPVRFTASDGAGPNSLTLIDTLTWGEELTIPVDLVVLVTGMVSRDISDLVGMMKLPLGSDRFLQEVHPKLRPVELANNGIFLAGSCQGPMDIGESCAAAEAAAVKASILLSKPEILLDPFVARVNEERCDGCEKCLAECSYNGALTMQDRDGGPRLAVVNAALCVGCGACVAVCPPRAIDLAGWSLDQFDAMVDAISNELVLIHS